MAITTTRKSVELFTVTKWSLEGVLWRKTKYKSTLQTVLDTFEIGDGKRRAQRSIDDILEIKQMCTQFSKCVP